MLYCPRCNNTHWTPTEQSGLMTILRLKRELECGKCGKVMAGSIFMKTGHSKDRTIKCPTCKGTAIRARRTGVERLIFFLRAYRCPDCKHRFHRIHLSD